MTAQVMPLSRLRPRAEPGRCRAGRYQRDLRRARASRRCGAASPARLSGDRAEMFVQGDASSCGEIARLQAEADLEGARRPGDARSRCHGGWRPATAATARLGLTGFLLGRITGYAGYSPQVSRRGLVRPAGGQRQRAAAASSGRSGGRAQSAGAGGLYGAADTGIALDTVERMKAALAAGSPPRSAWSSSPHPEAPHAFHADHRPSFPCRADGRRERAAWHGSGQAWPERPGPIRARLIPPSGEVRRARGLALPGRRAKLPRSPNRTTTPHPTLPPHDLAPRLPSLLLGQACWRCR